ncbi:MAG: thioredoxin family protein [Victivallales bacterium]|nr:thioredoxin family protein [Victivallales bacterium]
MWKKILTVLTCTALLSSSAFAKDKDAKEAKAEKVTKKEEKAAKKMWLTDFEKAKETAKEKNLPILALFTGSDWCPWCVKLNQEVFVQPEFQKYASKNLVLFIADFPRKNNQTKEQKKQYKELGQKYQIEGFPTVLLLDAEENVIGKTGYQQGGAENYVKHLKKMLK